MNNSPLSLGLCWLVLGVSAALSACGGTSVEQTTGSGSGATTGAGGGGTTTSSTTSSSGGGGASSTTATSSSTTTTSSTTASSSATTGGGGAGGGAGSGGAGGGAGSGGAGGGGDVNASALCSMPAMTDLFSGPFPPNPYAAAIAADPCVSAAHDVIVLLGCPNNDDGTPSPCQTKRVDMGISLKNAGWGGRFITTGGAVHNAYVEAETLRQLLLAKGVADGDIFVEPLAQHTDENVYFSTKIMETHGWESALVVSDDPGHLVMTALCDSNCCVALGRLTVVSLPVSGGTVVTGHYARHPWGEAVTAAECDLLKQPLKFMCVNLASRKACKDNFQL